MAIFNSYVKLPEGNICRETRSQKEKSSSQVSNLETPTAIDGESS